MGWECTAKSEPQRATLGVQELRIRKRLYFPLRLLRNLYMDMGVLYLSTRVCGGRLKDQDEVSSKERDSCQSKLNHLWKGL